MTIYGYLHIGWFGPVCAVMHMPTVSDADHVIVDHAVVSECKILWYTIMSIVQRSIMWSKCYRISSMSSFARTGSIFLHETFSKRGSMLCLEKTRKK